MSAPPAPMLSVSCVIATATVCRAPPNVSLSSPFHTAPRRPPWFAKCALPLENQPNPLPAKFRADERPPTAQPDAPHRRSAAPDSIAGDDGGVPTHTYAADSRSLPSGATSGYQRFHTQAWQGRTIGKTAPGVQTKLEMQRLADLARDLEVRRSSPMPCPRVREFR